MIALGNNMSGENVMAESRLVRIELYMSDTRASRGDPRSYDIPMHTCKWRLFWDPHSR